jgi:hypothetical protein
MVVFPQRVNVDDNPLDWSHNGWVRMVQTRDGGPAIALLVALGEAQDHKSGGDEQQYKIFSFHIIRFCVCKNTKILL